MSLLESEEEEKEDPAALPASLNSATSYSRFPGDSSTIPDTRAAGGLKLSLSRSEKEIEIGEI